MRDCAIFGWKLSDACYIAHAPVLNWQWKRVRDGLDAMISYDAIIASLHIAARVAQDCINSGDNVYAANIDVSQAICYHSGICGGYAGAWFYVKSFNPNAVYHASTNVMVCVGG